MADPGRSSPAKEPPATGDPAASGSSFGLATLAAAALHSDPWASHATTNAGAAANHQQASPSGRGDAARSGIKDGIASSRAAAAADDVDHGADHSDWHQLGRPLDPREGRSALHLRSSATQGEGSGDYGESRASSDDNERAMSERERQRQAGQVKRSRQRKAFNSLRANVTALETAIKNLEHWQTMLRVLGCQDVHEKCPDFMEASQASRNTLNTLHDSLVDALEKNEQDKLAGLADQIMEEEKKMSLQRQGVLRKCQMSQFLLSGPVLPHFLSEGSPLQWWMQLFLATYEDMLPEDVRATCEQLASKWAALSQAFNEELAASAKEMEKQGIQEVSTSMAARVSFVGSSFVLAPSTRERSEGTLHEPAQPGPLPSTSVSAGTAPQDGRIDVRRSLSENPDATQPGVAPYNRVLVSHEITTMSELFVAKEQLPVEMFARFLVAKVAVADTFDGLSSLAYEPL